MGTITKELVLVGRKGRRKFKALFDTGSNYSLIRGDLARQIGEPSEIGEPKIFEAAVGTFKAYHYFFADTLIRGHRLWLPLQVIEGWSEELIIGTDFMQRYHIKLDPATHRIRLDPQALRMRA